MEIMGISDCPYEDNDGEVLNLRIRLEDGERLAVGETIVIPILSCFLCDERNSSGLMIALGI